VKSWSGPPARLIISLTYGREPGATAMKQRFGPINGKQGHRRLNTDYPDPDGLPSAQTLQEDRMSDASVEHQPRRLPRFFVIPLVAPMTTAKAEPTAEPKLIRRKTAISRKIREIPASQFGRVRALTNYGMTGAQVAGLYGVTVNEIDRIIGVPC